MSQFEHILRWFVCFFAGHVPTDEEANTTQCKRCGEYVWRKVVGERIYWE